MESDPLRRAEIMLQQADKLGCRSFISVKLTFSKKVTKIDKIFTVDLTVTTCHTVKLTAKILSISVAFSENVNFKQTVYKETLWFKIALFELNRN